MDNTSWCTWPRGWETHKAPLFSCFLPVFLALRKNGSRSGSISCQVLFQPSFLVSIVTGFRSHRGKALFQLLSPLGWSPIPGSVSTWEEVCWSPPFTCLGRTRPPLWPQPAPCWWKAHSCHFSLSGVVWPGAGRYMFASLRVETGKVESEVKI